MSTQKSFLSYVLTLFSKNNKGLLLISVLVFSLSFISSKTTAQPVASFSVDPTGGCNPLTVEFTDLSTGSNLIWIYRYGDGVIDTLTVNGNTFHTYLYQTYYTAELKVLNTVTLDADSTTNDIDVAESPGIDFLINNPQTSYCVNEPVEFVYFPGTAHYDSLVWDFGDGNFSRSSVNPVTHTYSVNGSYEVKLYSYLKLCSDTAIHNVSVQGPVSSFTMSDSEGCEGDKVTFTLGASSGVDTYTWYPEGEGGPAIVNTSPYEHTYTSWDLYSPYLEVKDVSYTCNLYDTTVNIFRVEANIGYKSEEFCEGRNVYFNNISHGNDINTWDLGNGNTSTDFDPIEIYSAGDYTIKLNIANTFGCVDSTSEVITVSTIPTISVGLDTTVCIGDSARLSASGGHIIEWKPKQGVGNIYNYTTMASPQESVEYTPVVEDTITHCKSVQGSVIQTVNIIEVPDIVFGVIIPDTIIVGDVIVIDIDSNSNFNYLWSPDQYISCTNCANPVLQPISNGNNPYNLMISDIFDCSSSDTTINIYVREEYTFGVPEAFTPNGDGVNDIVKVDGWGIKELNEFSIFNRWGKKVFSTASIDEGWDGTFDGKEQSVDTYTFYIKIERWDGKIEEKRGAISLYR